MLHVSSSSRPGSSPTRGGTVAPVSPTGRLARLRCWTCLLQVVTQCLLVAHLLVTALMTASPCRWTSICVTVVSHLLVRVVLGGRRMVRLRRVTLLLLIARQLVERIRVRINRGRDLPIGRGAAHLGARSPPLVQVGLWLRLLLCQALAGKTSPTPWT